MLGAFDEFGRYLKDLMATGLAARIRARQPQAAFGTMRGIVLLDVINFFDGPQLTMMAVVAFLPAAGALFSVAFLFFVFFFCRSARSFGPSLDGGFEEF
jgi:hypothetical protein